MEIIDNWDLVHFQVSSTLFDLEDLGRKYIVKLLAYTGDDLHTTLLEVALFRFNWAMPEDIYDVWLWADQHGGGAFHLVEALCKKPNSPATREFLEGNAFLIDSVQKPKYSDVRLTIPSAQILNEILQEFMAFSCPVFALPEPFPQEIYKGKRLQRRRKCLKKMWQDGLGLRQSGISPYLWTPSWHP